MFKIAVVTPYYNEDNDILEHCHSSVMNQSYPCTHILVADGNPKPQFDGQPETMHVILPQANADYGNTPRAIGGILADAYGFDAVAYLDADNWYDILQVRGQQPVAQRVSVQRADRSDKRHPGISDQQPRLVVHESLIGGPLAR